MSFLLYTLLFLLVLSSTYARLVVRDSPSQTLYIPVTVNQQQVYSVNVNMSSGTPQPFSFALSTSTGYSAVAGKSCTSCNGVTSYDQAASSSAVAVGDNAAGGFSSTAGSVNGTLIREDCKLHEVDGDAWSYPNQTIIVANQAQGQVFSPGISGVFGLGTNSRDGNFDATIYAGFFRRNPSKTNFTYGMALKAPTDASSTDGGQLHWLAPDPSAYTGEVQWKPMVAATTGSTTNSSVPADWTIELDGFGFKSGSVTVSQAQAGLLTVLDPWFTGIVFPQSQVKTIYSSIDGASIAKQSDVTNVWKVPCDTKMTLVLTFGSIAVSFDESSLIRVENGQCLGVIEDWLSASDSQYLLGSSVLSKIYLIFSITDGQNGQVGVAQRSDSTSTKKFQTMAIVGVTLGSVAFLVVLVICGWLFYRRRRRQQTKEKTAPVQPYPTSRPTSPRENAALLAPGSTSVDPSPLSSPDWYAAHPGSLGSAHQTFISTSGSSSRQTRPSTTRPSTIQLSSDSGDMDDSPPPYILTTDRKSVV